MERLSLEHLRLTVANTSSRLSPNERCSSPSTNPHSTTMNDEENQTETEEISTKIISAFMGDQLTDALAAMKYFRKLLSRKPKPSVEIERVLCKDFLLSRFVCFLTKDDQPKLQLEAARIIRTIAAGTSEQTHKVVESEAVPSLIKSLDSPCGNVQKSAVRALSSISGHCNECRDLALHSGMLDPLLCLIGRLEKNDPKNLRTAVGALSNLCNGKNSQSYFSKVKMALPTLARLLSHSDIDVLIRSCWALGNLCNGPDDDVQAVIDESVCGHLITFLGSSSDDLVQAAAGALANIAAGNNTQAQVILDLDVLAPLKSLLQRNDMINDIRFDICIALANILAGNQDQIQRVLDLDFFPLLVGLLGTTDLEAHKQALWCFKNALHCGSVNQIQAIVGLGVIPSLCELLESTDVCILDLTLACIEDILRAGQSQPINHGQNPNAALIEQYEGCKKLGVLQSQSCSLISRNARKLVDNYFGDTNSEDEWEIC